MDAIARQADARYARVVRRVVSSRTLNSARPPQIPNGKTIIHCTNDPADINKEFETEAAILGDAKLVLEALIAEIGSKRRTADDVAAESLRISEA